MKKILFPIAFAIIFIGSMVLGIVATESVNKNAEHVAEIKTEQDFMESLYGEVGRNYSRCETTKKVDENTNAILRIYSSDNGNAKVEKIWVVRSGSGEYVGRMYYIKSTHKTNGTASQTLGVYVAFNGDPTKEDVEIAGYNIFEVEVGDYFTEYVNAAGKTYHDMYMLRVDNYWKYQDVTQKSYLENYSNISGATYTTEAIINVFMLARKQIYDDANVKVPQPDLQATLVSCTQTSTFELFNCEMTLTSERYNKLNLEVSFEYNFSTSTAIVDSVKDANTKEVVEVNEKESVELAKKFALPKVYVMSYTFVSALEKQYVVMSKVDNYGFYVKTAITLNSDNEISAISVVQDQAGGKYHTNGINDYSTYSPIESETFGYSIDNAASKITNISNATYTSNAFKAALNYLSTWIGGTK